MRIVLTNRVNFVIDSKAFLAVYYLEADKTIDDNLPECCKH